MRWAGAPKSNLRQATILQHQENILRQQQEILAQQQAALSKHASSLMRQEPSWIGEPPAAQKRRCLRSTFLHGTEAVEKSVFSEHGVDGILDAIFKLFVEVGAGDCENCTSRFLRDQGWRGLALDRDHQNLSINLHQALVTGDSVVGLFRLHTVPASFDQLTVTADMGTWWVLQAALQGGYRPRIITAQFNRNLSPWAAISTDYEPNSKWSGDCHFGAGLYALRLLFDNFGYMIVAQDGEGRHVFAVHAPEVAHSVPISYAAVTKAIPERASPCWGLYSRCRGKRWVNIPDNVELWRPREEWYEFLTPVILEQEAITRRDNKTVQIFIQYEAEGQGTRKAKGEQGARLEAGCL